MSDESEKIVDHLLIDSLAHIVRGFRRKELEVLKRENAAMRGTEALSLFYKSKPTVQALVTLPKNMTEALRLVLNGEPLSSSEIYVAVQRQFPHLRAGERTCRVVLCQLHNLGEVKVDEKGKDKKGQRRWLYTKAV